MIGFENYSYVSPSSNGDINGIFHKYKNINLVVRVSSSFNSIHYTKESQINASSPYNWVSLGDKNPWYSVSFPKNLIYLTNYSIQAGDFGCTSCCFRFPSQWKLESKKYGRWKQIDFVENSGFTNQSTKVVLTRKVFIEDLFSELKFTFFNPHVNYINCEREVYHVTIYKLDFFGFLAKMRFNPITMRCKRSIGSFFFIISLIYSK